MENLKKSSLLPDNQEVSHEIYMRRCLDLAALGLGMVQPNPLVGAVLVAENRIIGEGWHQKFGSAHAEINAINAVTEPQLLTSATLYVNLEPCAHFGKTPPCADAIIKQRIPHVVIGCTDPFAKVNGNGIRKLQSAGIQVVTDVLKDDCTDLNRRFFTFHQKKRPYIILKWAQTKDGYINPKNDENPTPKYWISNHELRILTHKWRSEEDALLVGYNTYKNDAPQLNNRFFAGKSPRPIILEKEQIWIEEKSYKLLKINDLEEVLSLLYEQQIQSVIVEGGRKTLDRFLAANVWDEARILVGDAVWGSGTPAPTLHNKPENVVNVNGNLLMTFRNRER